MITGLGDPGARGRRPLHHRPVVVSLTLTCLIFILLLILLVSKATADGVEGDPPAVGITWAGTAMPSNTVDLVVKDNHAYVVSISGLLILDVSDWAEPEQMAFLGLSGTGHDIVVQDDMAYLAFGNEGVYTIDISNPARPKMMGNLDTPGSAEGIAKTGNHICVADGSQGSLLVIDVTDPTKPILVGE